MTRFTIVLAILIAAAVALGVFVFSGPDEEPADRPSAEVEGEAGDIDAVPVAPDTDADGTADSDAAKTEPGSSDDATVAAPDDGGDTAAAEPSAEEEDGAVRPGFDVVRVERTGDAVIAGRAEPGSRVTVYSGDEIVGEAEADGRGEWVVITEKPLAPGSHRLDLEATTPEGDRVKSDNEVVIMVPQPPKVAGAGSGAAGSGTDESGSAGSATAGASAGEQVASAEGSGDDSQQEAFAVIVPREGDEASRLIQAPEGAGVSDSDLVLQAVDYDENGRVVVSGQAPPDARIVVFLDGEVIGESRADAEGRWQVRPIEAVAPGLHRLRVDQVDHSGQVVASIEVPFARAQFAEEPGESRFVVVEPGNSLWVIARSAYGRGTLYTTIYQANIDQIADPDLIYPGQIFLVPKN